LLKTATNECENPDLRDRAYIYWRLLLTDAELTRKIVFSERPTISDQSYTVESALLDKLVENIGNLSSVYMKPPESFVKKLRDVLN
jgi:vesicle coat complex subunit